MLKFEGIETGTKIRAWDFEPCSERTDRYAEGVIKEVVSIHGALCYRVEVEKDTAFVNNPRPEIFVPFEVCSFDWDNRVEII